MVSGIPGELLASFFDRLALAELRVFVRHKREEDLHLEFKQKANRNDGNIADNDRDGFSRTVSAFANAAGGILIFGVETKRSGDNPEHAARLKSFKDPDRFRTKLFDSILNTTQPPVDGIRLETIADKDGTGYVKCLIPASDRPPHRAMFPSREREYWRRASNGNRRMDHYELEDVFGRRLRPVLLIGITIRLRPEPDPHEEIYFTFGNEGRGLALHAGFFCSLGQGKIMGTYGLRDESANNQQRPSLSYYDPHGAIHPNGINASLGVATILRSERGKPLPLTVRWYAANMAAREETVEVEADKPTMLSGVPVLGK